MRRMAAITLPEGELSAAARVLHSRGETDEALKLRRVNCALHRASATCQTRLAEALLDAGDTEDARDALERALRLNDDAELAREMAELLKRAYE